MFQHQVDTPTTSYPQNEPKADRIGPRRLTDEGAHQRPCAVLEIRVDEDVATFTVR